MGLSTRPREMETMNVADFRYFYVQPTLEYLAKTEPRILSQAAEELLVATAVHESGGLLYLHQRTGKNSYGPAFSFYQIESETHQDVLRYLAERRVDLLNVITLLRMTSNFDINQLAANLFYSTAISRVKYWMVPETLPKADDIYGMASYWGRYYQAKNDPKKINKFIRDYNRYVKE